MLLLINRLSSKFFATSRLIKFELRLDFCWILSVFKELSLPLFKALLSFLSLFFS